MKLNLLQVFAGLIVVTALVLSSGIAEPKEPHLQNSIKYWQGINGTVKEGQCGTMSGNGLVPDSIEITKAEYDQHVADLPVIIPVYEIIKYKDVDTGKIYRLQKVHEVTP